MSRPYTKIEWEGRQVLDGRKRILLEPGVVESIRRGDAGHRIVAQHFTQQIEGAVFESLR